MEKFGDNLRTNVNLASYSWFNLGGPAQYFYKAKDKNQLIEFLEEAKKEKLNITIIGAGSNILFRDKGVSAEGHTYSNDAIRDKNTVSVDELAEVFLQRLACVAGTCNKGKAGSDAALSSAL